MLTPCTKFPQPQNIVECMDHFIQEHTVSECPTIVLWKDNYWRWLPDKGCYHLMTKKEVEVCLTRWLRRPEHHKFLSQHAQAQRLLDADVYRPSTVSSTQNAWLDDRPGDWVALKNGILNLSAAITGKYELEEHSPLWFSNVCLPFDCDPAASCPKWEQFLVETLEGDSERIELLQQWFGYCLTNQNDREKFLLVTGEGGTGKSTLLKVLRLLVGSGNVSSVPLQKLGGSYRFDLFQTYGKALNICPDAMEIKKMDEGDLKAFTSSSDYLTFENKNVTGFSARPTAKLAVACNTLPHFHDKSSGLWRRILLMPFERVIPPNHRDVRYARDDFWMDELPGIFNWAILGEMTYQSSGWTKAELCEQKLQQYRSDCDPVGEWLLESFERDKLCCVNREALMHLHREYFRTNGHHFHSWTTLQKRLQQLLKLRDADVKYRVNQENGKIPAVRGLRYTGIESDVRINSDSPPTAINIPLAHRRT